MKKNYWYQILFFILSIVFIYIFFTKFGEIKSAVLTLSGGIWYFIIASLILQGIAIYNRGALFHSLYDYFSVKDTLIRFVKISLASNFLNLAAPSGGFSGIALFISEAKAQGVTKSKVVIINLIYYFLIYGFFLFVLLFGLFYLFFNNQLHPYQLITAGILFGIVLFILVFGLVAIDGIVRFKKLVSFFATIVNFFSKLLVRRQVVTEPQIKIISQEASDTAGLLAKNWRDLTLTVLHVILTQVIDIITLYYLFLAFGFYIYPGVLITAYAVGFLFQFISITPSGVGVVEATMILVLTGMKVPVEVAAIVVFGYRFITFWLPFALGFVAFRELKKET